MMVETTSITEVITEKSTNHSSEDIPSFFKDSTVLLTGVTGFLGHVLLSKLLSSCPEIKKIYILMREKKGVNIKNRFEEMFDVPVFDKMKKLCPQYLHKIASIKGDLVKPNLGICENDVCILENEVNVVFHVAATVRFDAPLRDAVYINVRSTSDLLEIATNMKNLKSFVHVSTIFSYCPERKFIEEKLYDPPLSPQNLLALVETLDDNVLDRITPKLLQPYPNTYIFTKAVAEDVCASKSQKLPITIFRPAIVISTADEPIPGWINNYYGPTGIVAAAGIGLMRTLHADKNCKANIVPCDYVINAAIASAWHTAKAWQHSKNSSEKFRIPIFNYSSTETKKAITWKQFMDENEMFEPRMPFSLSMWAYSLTLNKNKFMNQLYIYVLHLFPALLVDSFAVLCGRKPRLWKTYEKIHKLDNALSYFSTRQWIVSNDNVQRLFYSLSEKDKAAFNFDLDKLNWKSYFSGHVHGIRLYIIKDEDETIPYALKKRKKLLITHYTLISIITGLLSYICYNLFRALV